MVDAETANLDRVLADVSANVGSVPFGSLHGRQGVILPRLDRIVAKTERGIAVRGGRGNAQQMFRLIEQVPPAALEPYRTRLDALKDKDAWFVFRLQ